MDREWLATQLEAGRSIESIAREVGRHPSTVGHWVRKYGLRSQHAERHAAKGGIERDTLAELVARGLPSRAIAAELGCSQATVRHWLAKYGFVTRAGVPLEERPREVERTCSMHGLTVFVRYGKGHDSYRCLACRKERVIARRRKVKEILVAEAGGSCRICGYDRYIGALQFHHLDPATKSFGLGMRGIARSLERCREEARKCILLCANCHAEVEGGAAELPYVPALRRAA
jgi:transposase-like protein